MTAYKDFGVSPRNKPMRALIRPEYEYKASSAGTTSFENSTKTMRPPCRQSDNLFDLDDLTPKPNKKVIRIVRKQARPPSRHKTPPKAVGLDLPPNNCSSDFNSLGSTPVSQSLSSSQPIVSEGFPAKHLKFTRKLRADSVKSKTAYEKNEEISGSRAYSAKKKTSNAPPPINKRKSESSQGTSAPADITQTPNEPSKRSTSRVKHQNFPIFTDLQTEFLDLFA